MHVVPRVAGADVDVLVTKVGDVGDPAQVVHDVLVLICRGLALGKVGHVSLIC
jgi:hypothetical protein